jgi:CHRD domain
MELTQMKHVFYLLAVLTVGFGVAACTSDSSTSPSSSSTAQFTAALTTANEVPAIANEEAGGSATATITFNLTKDSSETVTAATMNLAVTASGFPAGTALTKAHIHSGGAGTNGGIFVNVGLTDGEVAFPSGGGSFTRTAIPMTADQAAAILANPAGFYFNIHTARNPDGVARGQLARAQ